MTQDLDLQGTPRHRAVADPLLSVVMPVFNEVQVLDALVSLVTRAAAECCDRCEIIFVNDGSTDGSQEALDLLAARRSEIKVIHLSRNFGHQAAVQAGLQHAPGDAVVLMDSDLQDAPDAIPRFFAAWQEGFDVVYAVRTKRKEGLLKRLLFGGFHRLLSSISSTPIPVDAGIFGLIDGRVARTIAALSEHDRYLPGLRSWVGFRQTGVVVERLARYDRHARVSLRGLCRLAKTAIFSFSAFPLAIFYGIGLTALAVFLGVSGFALFCKLFTQVAIPGWTSHVLSATFFGAINALGISILGEYVTRIYDQVRQRPLYLVARTVNLAGQRSEACSVATFSAEPPLKEFESDVIDDLLGVLVGPEIEDEALNSSADVDADDYLALLEEAQALLSVASRERSATYSAPKGAAAYAGDVDEEAIVSSRAETD